MTSGQKQQWGRSAEFVLALVGYAVGIGNIWRFPSLCFANGGAAFLIPYFAVTIFVAIPIFCLEIAVGQRTQKGPLALWRRMSIWTSGTGVSTTVVCFLVSLYYNLLIAYAFFYLGVSLTHELPWTERRNAETGEIEMNAQIFLEREFLGITDDAGTVGTLQWRVIIPFTFAWLLIFLILFRGVKGFGKVVYVTSTFPYVVLTVLVVRGVTLPGAWEGLKFYLIPDWPKILDPMVWAAAGQQVFFSTSVGWGSYVTFGSMNPIKYDFYPVVWSVPGINAATSIYAGFAVFGVLGFLSHQSGVAVEKLGLGGIEMAFVAYPTAVTHLPVAPLWSALFFIMLVSLGVSCQFGLTETVVDGMVEGGFAPSNRRWVNVAVVCGLSWVLGLFFCTGGGLFYADLVDYYAFSLGIFLIVLAEIAGTTIWYGAKKLVEDLRLLTGRRLPDWFPWMWISVTPLSLLAITGMSLYSVATYEPHAIACRHRSDGVVTESCKRAVQWYRDVGGFLSVVPAIPLVVVPLYFLFRRQNIKQTGSHKAGVLDVGDGFEFPPRGVALKVHRSDSQLEITGEGEEGEVEDGEDLEGSGDGIEMEEGEIEVGEETGTAQNGTRKGGKGKKGPRLPHSLSAITGTSLPREDSRLATSGDPKPSRVHPTRQHRSPAAAESPPPIGAEVIGKVAPGENEGEG